MKKILMGAVAALIATPAMAMDAPMNSEGLKALALTGWATKMAEEGRGASFDKDGGMPGAFTYEGSLMPGEMEANMLLGEGEFLAPHYLATWDGSRIVMVAPHLIVDGKVVKGANPNKDHFIVVYNATGEMGIPEAVRYDYSMTYEGM